jgi:hypothetical protein
MAILLQCSLFIQSLIDAMLSSSSEGFIHVKLKGKVSGCVLIGF